MKRVKIPTLIVIEGTDGSGKATQTQMVVEHLKEEGYLVEKVSFPDYDSQSSALVKMYLNGEFGSHPDDVNAYTASLFYAVDRFASFKKNWESAYNNGVVIVSDRYTISNAIHQGSKLTGDAKSEYLNWLYDLEFHKIGIPEPDLIFYLDVPSALTNKLRSLREQKLGTNPDIHERDKEYLLRTRSSALEIAEKSSWTVVNCAVTEELMRTREGINAQLMENILSFLKPRTEVI